MHSNHAYSRVRGGAAHDADGSWLPRTRTSAFCVLLLVAIQTLVQCGVGGALVWVLGTRLPSIGRGVDSIVTLVGGIEGGYSSARNLMLERGIDLDQIMRGLAPFKNPDAMDEFIGSTGSAFNGGANMIRVGNSIGFVQTATAMLVPLAELANHPSTHIFIARMNDTILPFIGNTSELRAAAGYALRSLLMDSETIVKEVAGTSLRISERVLSGIDNTLNRGITMSLFTTPVATAA